MERQDALLVSINDRLGALLPWGSLAGQEIAPLSPAWMSDLVELARRDIQARPKTGLEELEEELEEI